MIPQMNKARDSKMYNIVIFFCVLNSVPPTETIDPWNAIQTRIKVATSTLEKEYAHKYSQAVLTVLLFPKIKSPSIIYVKTKSPETNIQQPTIFLTSAIFGI